MDKFTKEKRSEIMSKIRSKDTTSEIILRKALFKAGIRGYRIQKRIHKIRPDIIFQGKKIAIFMDGCFWHGCPKCFKAPESNKEYWGPKIQGNIERDIRNIGILETEGWIVLRFWEHEVKKELEGVIETISVAVNAVPKGKVKLFLEDEEVFVHDKEEIVLDVLSVEN